MAHMRLTEIDYSTIELGEYLSAAGLTTKRGTPMRFKVVATSRTIGVPSSIQITVRYARPVIEMVLTSKELTRWHRSTKRGGK
jgi:hypothetical protein